MEIRKILLFIACICSALLIWAVDKSADIQNAQEEMNKMTQDASKKILLNRFIIEGNIVDDAGNPLNDVQLQITQSIKLGLLGSKESKSTKVLISDFSLELSGCTQVYLTFSKDGYFVVSNKSYDINNPEKGQEKTGNTLIAKKQKIILQKIGKIARYKSFNPSLKLYPDNKLSIFELDNFYTIKNYSAESLKNSIPPNSFYLSVERDPSDNIIKVLNRGNNREVPKVIYLNFNCSKNDGLIIVKDVTDIKMLKEAPADGYNIKQIVFSAQEDLINNNIFFYYKAGNSYGKGSIDSISYSGSGLLKVGLQLMQNNEKDPKEKRNLQSFQY